MTGSKKLLYAFLVVSLIGAIFALWLRRENLPSMEFETLIQNEPQEINGPLEADSKANQNEKRDVEVPEDEIEKSSITRNAPQENQTPKILKKTQAEGWDGNAIHQMERFVTAREYLREQWEHELRAYFESSTDLPSDAFDNYLVIQQSRKSSIRERIEKEGIPVIDIFGSTRIYEYSGENKKKMIQLMKEIDAEYLVIIKKLLGEKDLSGFLRLKIKFNSEHKNTGASIDF